MREDPRRGGELPLTPPQAGEGLGGAAVPLLLPLRPREAGVRKSASETVAVLVGDGDTVPASSGNEENGDGGIAGGVEEIAELPDRGAWPPAGRNMEEAGVLQARR